MTLQSVQADPLTGEYTEALKVTEQVSTEYPSEFSPSDSSFSCPAGCFLPEWAPGLRVMKTFLFCNQNPNGRWMGGGKGGREQGIHWTNFFFSFCSSGDRTQDLLGKHTTLELHSQPFFFFWHKVSLWSPDWSPTRNPPASASPSRARITGLLHLADKCLWNAYCKDGPVLEAGDTALWFFSAGMGWGGHRSQSIKDH
jgi:hypothetical protein